MWTRADIRQRRGRTAERSGQLAPCCLTHASRPETARSEGLSHYTERGRGDKTRERAPAGSREGSNVLLKRTQSSRTIRYLWLTGTLASSPSVHSARRRPPLRRCAAILLLPFLRYVPRPVLLPRQKAVAMRSFHGGAGLATVGDSHSWS